VYKIQPVILAGGTGSRLWPMSRELYPKQLLTLTGEYSLLQTTALRVWDLPGTLPPIVVVGEEHRFLTLSQLEALPGLHDFTVILEPCGRNTAPAICAATEYCRGQGDDLIFLILPADHIINNRKGFAEAVLRAAQLAENGSIVTFGVQPTHPETGYGYIEKGDGATVLSFKEKPDGELAQQYLDSGNYFWNSGMFAFSGSVFREEIEAFAPEIMQNMREAVLLGKMDGRFFRLQEEAMASCSDDSIDYALMEKTSRAAVVEAELGWSDIGSWKALWDVMAKDDSGNVIKGDVVVEDSHNCLLQSETMLLAGVGLEDLLVVEAADAVLVAPMSRTQDVKKIVARLKKGKRKEYSLHRTVHRPWGSYTVLEIQPRFQIKRISVKPGAKLSLQMHHHRYEHWVVVSGAAKVRNGEADIILQENQSTYIPAGVVHRLENPGVISLELIEVQIGSYLGEDDIVRLEDVYGRSE